MWSKNFDTIEAGWAEIERIVSHFLYVARQALRDQPQGWPNQISEEQKITGNYLPDMADRMHELGFDESRDRVLEIYSKIRDADIRTAADLEQIESTLKQRRSQTGAV